MDLSCFPRRRYTQGVTPIEPLARLSAALGGPTIHIKRDDTLGLFPGGNKTRKLEFLVADALARLEAVPLDPTYTGKAMAGLIGLVRGAEFKRSDHVLFIHTGGLPSLFAATEVVLGRVAVPV